VVAVIEGSASAALGCGFRASWLIGGSDVSWAAGRVVCSPDPLPGVMGATIVPRCAVSVDCGLEAFSLGRDTTVSLATLSVACKLVLDP
jgi:hypothetical protein